MSFIKSIFSKCNGTLITQTIRGPPKILYQVIRWRKPRWVPRAKSKEFYVRRPTPVDPEERVELKIRYDHYRTAVKSVRSYIRKTSLAKAQKEDDHLIREQEEREDWERILLKNKQWNEDIAQARSVSVQHEKVYFPPKWKTQLLNNKFEMIPDVIKLLPVLEQSKGFITLENMDIEIEKLLNSRKDYNFAIDKFGNVQAKESDTSVKRKHKAEDSQHG
ncbi:hypothetical protein ScPMuIL_001119 [Solemya velum]